MDGSGAGPSGFSGMGGGGGNDLGAHTLGGGGGGIGGGAGGGGNGGLGGGPGGHSSVSFDLKVPLIVLFGEDRKFSFANRLFQPEWSSR